jgi:hypothetical protein
LLFLIPAAALRRVSLSLSLSLFLSSTVRQTRRKARARFHLHVFVRPRVMIGDRRFERARSEREQRSALAEQRRCGKRDWNCSAHRSRFRSYPLGARTRTCSALVRSLRSVPPLHHSPRGVRERINRRSAADTADTWHRFLSVFRIRSCQRSSYPRHFIISAAAGECGESERSMVSLDQRKSTKAKTFHAPLLGTSALPREFQSVRVLRFVFPFRDPL